MRQILENMTFARPIPPELLRIRGEPRPTGCAAFPPANGEMRLISPCAGEPLAQPILPPAHALGPAPYSR